MQRRAWTRPSGAHPCAAPLQARAPAAAAAAGCRRRGTPAAAAAAGRSFAAAPLVTVRRRPAHGLAAPQPRRWQQGSDHRRTLTVPNSAATGLLPLGFDLLVFLSSTVVMVPLCKRVNVSPVLGFLVTGVVLHQLGLIRDPKDMEALSELGVLFLLFEMGLELSLDRLKALAKYAFGLGTLQMLICTGIFTAFALPAGQGLGTHLLEWLAHAPSSLVSIRSVDEAVVIGGALSMSSSAFVLQLLSERGEMPSKFGQATLGILLLQDIAVVPFLVLLPLVVQLQSSGVGDPVAALADAASGAVAAAQTNPASLVAMLGPTALKTCAGLAVLLLGGRVLLRRVFELVAQSDNSETFVGLCLLTVAGAALLTESLGFSDTMGAFVAGVLLSESSYKTQVEADIRPFRGLLLGLFFVTTGGSIDMGVLRSNWNTISWILVGLITVKTAVVAALGPSFGLSKSESIRTGFMLSQGGEFAFVLLSLASSLHVLPDNLNQVLIIVVVLSMALTPGLAQAGKVVGDWVEEATAPRDADGALLAAAGVGGAAETLVTHGVEDPVLIVGFGPHGQMLAALLDQPLASLPDPSLRYIAFDLDPSRVQAAREAGFNVVYGDGSRAAVLRAAGVERPKAVAVCLTQNKTASHRAVASLRLAFPTVPIFCLGSDIKDAAELEEAGADRCIMGSTSMGVSLGTEILTRLGASQTEAAQVGRELEEAMTIKAHSLAEEVARYGAGAIERDATLRPLIATQHPRSASPAASAVYVPAAATAAVTTPAPATIAADAAAVPALAVAVSSNGAAAANGAAAQASSPVAAAAPPADDAAAALKARKAAAVAKLAAVVQASVDLVEDEEAAKVPPRATTPAPPDTLPSMEGAMPARAAARAAPPASADTVAAAVGGNGAAGSNGARGAEVVDPVAEEERRLLAEAAKVAEPGRRPEAAAASPAAAAAAGEEEVSAAAAEPAARGGGSGGGAARGKRIAATATASLEICDDEGECQLEEVAGLVLVDAGKQHLQSQQQWEAQRASGSSLSSVDDEAGGVAAAASPPRQRVAAAAAGGGAALEEDGEAEELAGAAVGLREEGVEGDGVVPELVPQAVPLSGGRQ